MNCTLATCQHSVAKQACMLPIYPQKNDLKKGDDFTRHIFVLLGFLLIFLNDYEIKTMTFMRVCDSFLEDFR